MSSSPVPPKEVDADDMANAKDWKAIVEKLSKMEEAFIQLFVYIMTHLLKKYPDCMVGPLKVLLECPICKELIVEAVTRTCCHTFCNYCMMEWLKNSTDCPVCRDTDDSLAKNSTIDEIINLLVEGSFTKEEKSERDQSIQQRSPPATILPKDDENDDGLSAAFNTLDVVSKNELPCCKDMIVMNARISCLEKAQTLIFETFATKDLNESSSAVVEDSVQLLLNFVLKSYGLRLKGFIPKI